MKKKRRGRPTPTIGKLTVFAQLCNHIPGHLVAKLARETGVETMARTFSAWSHVVAMLYAQMTHAIGLNDVCDALRRHVGWLARIRGATPPSRNGLSPASKRRDATMAEKLFWQVLAHVQQLQPHFAIVDTARDNDNARPGVVCRHPRRGDRDFRPRLRGPGPSVRLAAARRVVGAFRSAGLLDFYGTARKRWRMRAQPEQGYLPGFAPVAMG